MTQKTDPEDVIAWPCGTWCFRSELPEFGHKSDDFEVLSFDSPEWHKFMDEQDYADH